jgi:hypothetical protein
VYRTIAALVTATALTACALEATDYQAAPLTSAQEAAVKSAVAYRLRDATSARWRNIVAITNAQGRTYVCGQVNSTNGFGGYTGFMPFWGRWQTSGAFRVEHIATPNGAPYFDMVCPR